MLLSDLEDTLYILKKMDKNSFSCTAADIYFKSLDYFLEEVKAGNIPIVHYFHTKKGDIMMQVQDEYYVVYPYIVAKPYSP